MNKHTGSVAYALLLLLVLSGLSAAILLKSVNENKVAKRVSDSTAAFWLAEAGIQKAMYEYNNNNCQGMVQSGTATACTSCTSCGGGNKTLAGSLSGYGDYDITLNNANTSIQSVGSVPNRSSSSKIQRRIQATLGRPAIFDHGIFAQGQITLSNNALVDSYNSANGVYGGANILQHGNVGSNGISNGIISISNNADVYGHISTGPGGTVVTGNNVTLSDSNITHGNTVPLPAVVVPSTLTSLPSSGAINISNNAFWEVYPGDYKYTNVNFGNNSTININGNVRMYLTGSAGTALNTGNANVTFKISNGATLALYTDGKISFNNNTSINVVSKQPTSFLIYSTYSGANGITIDNNSTTYAGIYAPQTDINISNNAGFYGAVVAKTTSLDNNAEIHYDEALATMANPYEGAITSNWQEY